VWGSYNPPDFSPRSRHVRDTSFLQEVDPFFTLDQVLEVLLGGSIYFAYTPRLSPEEALTLLATYYGGDEERARELLAELEPLSEEGGRELP